MLRRFRKRLPHISRDQVFELSLEFIAIVIGVLLALAVDEWREGREIAQSNEIAVQRLNVEIRQNRDEVADSIKVVSHQFEELASLDVDGSRPFFEDFRQLGGFNLPNLKDSIWRRVNNDRWANHISATYIDQASLLYTRIDQLRELEREMNHYSFDENFHLASRAKVAQGITRQLMLRQIVLMREVLALHDDFIRRNISPPAGGDAADKDD